ncbi:MAG: invasin domain 3-containing protein, partial [Gaiellaceae bacterium]
MRARRLAGVVLAVALATAAVLFFGGTVRHGTPNAAQLPSWPLSDTLVQAHDGAPSARASVTVRFRAGMSSAQQHRLLARLGASETGSVPQLGLHVVSVAPARAAALLHRLRASHAVASATPDEVRSAAGSVADASIAGQWALPRIGWPGAYAARKAKRAVTVAVLDTGVALGGSTLPGFSAFAGSSPTSDPNGHGTLMASLALAVDPTARILPVQVLDRNGNGRDSDIIAGLIWAADHHAQVVLMSFAGHGYSPALQQAIDYAWSKGAVVVAATGNDGSAAPTYPAGDAKVVGVSATDDLDRLWSGSNYGSDTFLAAPGVGVTGLAVGGGTKTVTGTSASAALVAGGAALLLAFDPRASNAVAVARLARGADRAGTRAQTGNGRLDLLRSLRDARRAALAPAGVRSRLSGGPFVGPYVAAASIATTPVAVGSGSLSGSNTSIAITTTALIPKNSTLFIAIAENTTTSTGSWSVTDPNGAGDTWTEDASDATGDRTALLRTYVSANIPSSSTITVNLPVTTNLRKVWSAFYVDGLLSTSPVDQTKTNGSGGSTSWTTTLTATTTQAIELVVAAGSEGSNATFGSPTCTSAATEIFSATSFGLEPFYKKVAATGTYKCAATLSVSTTFGAVLATYKVDITNPAAAVTFPASSAVYNAAGWSGSVTGSATDESGGSGINTTAGQTQLSIHNDTTNQYWDGTSAYGSIGGAETYFNPTTGPAVVTPGTAATWSYTFANANLTNGDSYTVHTKTVDLATNASSVAASSFVYDTAAPSTASLTTNGVYNAAGLPASLTGTTTDAGTGGNGISAVNISIQDSTSGKCWNGANFTTATCPNYVAVTSGGTASGTANANWSYSTAGLAAQLASGDTYTVQIQATDATTSGNTSGNLAAGTFVYDNLAPNTASLTTNGAYNAAGLPASLTGTTTDAGTGGNGISAVNISIQDSTSGKCWNGTNFTTATCPNYVAVTSGGTASGTANANWSYATAGLAAQLASGDTYTVQIQATDATTSGNTSGNLAAGTFRYDNTAPVYASSATDAGGTHLTLTLTETGSGLDVSSTTPGSAFTVLVNGVGRTVSSVSTTDATHVQLTLASRVYGGDTVTVAYSTAGLTAAQEIKDLAGNVLATFTAQTATNTAPASLSQSTVSAGSVTADGTSTTTVTVQLKNSAGANLTTSGGTVTLATTDGTFPGSCTSGCATTDNANGTYTATLTSSKVAHNVTVTATLDGSNITTSGTGVVTFAPGAAAKLQVLMPGETANPGSVSGKTGSPSAQTAGSSFNATVNAVDANWNVVSTVTHTVAITSSDANATLPANAALSSGTGSFAVTFKTAAPATVTATDTNVSPLTANTGASTTVNPGAASKLQVLMPGETAVPGSASGKSGSPTPETAGSSFNATVNAVDANWNVVSSVTHIVAITSSDSNAVLPANAALSSGTGTFAVTFKTAAPATVTATDQNVSPLTANTGSTTNVNPGAASKLQVLMPGETAAPGTGTGKTGSPSAQTAGSSFNATVNAVDANWNVVSSVTHTVAITSSDSNAVLPANAALSSGTGTFAVTFKTAAPATVTATDQNVSPLSPGTGSSTTVNAGAAAKLQLLMPGETAAPGTGTGKTGSPSAQTAGSSFNATVNAVDANWNVVSSVTHTVAITSSDANAGLPANAALSSGTGSFAVTFKTAAPATVTATDTNVSPLTANTGASTTVNAGAAAKLQVLMPGETAAPGTGTGKTGSPSAQTAGSSFNATVNAVDANWNLVSSITHTLAITSSDSNAVLPANAALASGTGSFAVTFKTAAPATVTATDTNGSPLTANTGSTTNVNPGTATKLQLLMPGETAAPGTTSGKIGSPIAQAAGTPFNVTVNAVDANWNLVSSITHTVAITSSDTNAALPANAALSGGTGSFAVTFKTAAPATVTATDQNVSPLTAGTGASTTVNPGAATKLQLLMPGETAAPGTTSGKTGSPSAQVAGSSFNVTVNAVDANWNVVSSITHTVAITSSDANATLPANAALSSGTQTFAVTLNTAGAATVTATDTNGSPLAASTSPSTTVNTGAAAKLQVLMPGETAAPGTPTGKTGSPSAQTAGSSFSVTVNAVDANWNVIPSVSHVVAITSSDANAVLPANAALSSGTGTFAVTFKTAAPATVTATDQNVSPLTAGTGASTTVNPGAATKLQLL